MFYPFNFTENERLMLRKCDFNKRKWVMKIRLIELIKIYRIVSDGIT